MRGTITVPVLALDIIVRHVDRITTDGAAVELIHSGSIITALLPDGSELWFDAESGMLLEFYPCPDHEKK